VLGSQSRGRNSDWDSSGSINLAQPQVPSISSRRLKKGTSSDVPAVNPEASIEYVAGNVGDEVNSPAKGSWVLGFRVWV
jgi:hypothetical protein